MIIVLSCGKIETMYLKRKNVVLSLVFFAIYFIYILIISIIIENTIISRDMIWIMSWIGIVELLFILWDQYRNSHTIFNLYTIFMALTFLFNYGQFLLWAFGLHVEDDISTGKILYRSFSYNDAEIFRTQIYYVISMLAIHAGYSLMNTSSINKVEMLDKKTVIMLPDNVESRIVFKVSLLFCVIVIPITLIAQVRELLIALTYGYGRLYYGEYAASSFTIFDLSHMFFPCLIGLLIGSRYEKKTVRIVYIIFFIYFVIDLMKGDRGNWFYKLLILSWMHNTFYKRISKREIITILFGAFGGLYVIQAIKSVRKSGISLQAVQDALLLQNGNPVINFIAEMGNQFYVDLIVINKNVFYPFGNTYLLGLLAMVTMKIPALLNIEYIPLSNWFSADFLHISWGAGFTMIAEAVINFGLLGAPICLYIWGMISSRILDINRPLVKNSPYGIFVCISVSSFFIHMIRNQAHDFFKFGLYGCFPIAFVIAILLNNAKKK